MQQVESQCRLRILNGVPVTALTYSSSPCNHDQLTPKFETKTNILFPKPLKVIADVIIDQLVTFGYVMGRLTSPTSIEKNESKASKIFFGMRYIQ